MTAGNRRDTPPDPFGAGTVEELTARLRALRTWSGASYRVVHRDVVRLRADRGVAERPVYNTVYRCFQAGRSRLDVELVVDIARVLLGDDARAEQWRAACQVVAGQTDAAAIVDVSDRLPADLVSFIGRDGELRRLVAATGTVTIEGMPGVGKTRLAVRVAHRIDADIRLVVDLRGYDKERPPADPAAVLDGFLRRLGVPGDQLQHLDLPSRTARFRQMLAGKRAVVLLDNAGATEQVRPLLANVPGSLTLITSRRTLAGLDATQVRLDVFAADEALRLLGDAAGPAADLATAVEIAQLLGRLPLALAVTAARIRANPDWTLADHRERLVRHREALRLDDGVDLSVGLSYRDLAAAERRTFRLLSLHPGGDIERYAAAALAGIDPATAHRHLDQLLTANLLQQKEVGRYVFHDLIRLYAADRAADEEPASARRAALTRLFEHYEYAASQAMDQYAPYEKNLRPEIPPADAPAPEFIDYESAMEWLETERNNLLATARYAADNGSPIHASHQSEILMRYFDTAGRYWDAEMLHTRALNTTEPIGRVRAVANLANVHLRLGRLEEALSLLQHALPQARRLADRQTERRLLNHIGVALMLLGRGVAALPYYEASLRLARELNDRPGECAALDNLGSLFDGLGRYAEALDARRSALAIARELRDRASETRIVGNIAFVYTLQERNREALAHFWQFLVLAREVGNPGFVASALDGMGTIYAREGRYNDALDHHQQALEIDRRTGDRYGEAVVLMGLGMAYTGLRRYNDALDHHQEARDIARDTGIATLECEICNAVGATLLAMGSASEALDSHNSALELAKKIEAVHQEARAHDGIARAALALDDRDSARAHWQEALRLYTDIGVGANTVRARLDGLDDPGPAATS